MSELHKINRDLYEINGRPRWFWSLLAREMHRLNKLLESHAELQRRYPDEETNEADH